MRQRTGEVKVDHSEHGREAPDGGPADPDCPCRKGPHEAECARAGCGFCTSGQRSAEDRTSEATLRERANAMPCIHGRRFDEPCNECGDKAKVCRTCRQPGCAETFNRCPAETPKPSPGMGPPGTVFEFDVPRRPSEAKDDGGHPLWQAGRAHERALIIAWLDENAVTMSDDAIIEAIEAGEHEPEPTLRVSAEAPKCREATINADTLYTLLIEAGVYMRGRATEQQWEHLRAVREALALIVPWENMPSERAIWPGVYPAQRRESPATHHVGGERVPDALLHPNGACACAGEGRCEWCLTTEVIRLRKALESIAGGEAAEQSHDWEEFAEGLRAFARRALKEG